MSAEPTLTYNQTVRAITEFLEVAVHTILYVREVYPADVFVRRKKFGTPVFQARHPGLNAYVAGAIRAVREELLRGTVDKVVVVIKDRMDAPLERFVFSIRKMIDVEAYGKDDQVDDAMTPLALGNYFRSFLVKLNMIECQLSQMDFGEDVSFAIVLELIEGKVPTASQQKGDLPPWVPATKTHTTAGTSEDAQSYMVRAVDTGIINMSLLVQETEEKRRHMQRKTEHPDPEEHDTAGDTENTTTTIDKGKGKQRAE